MKVLNTMITIALVCVGIVIGVTVMTAKVNTKDYDYVSSRNYEYDTVKVNKMTEVTLNLYGREVFTTNVEVDSFTCSTEYYENNCITKDNAKALTVSAINYVINR